MRKPRIVVLDTETTGGENPQGVCEVAWQTLDENLQPANFVHSLIDPEKPITFSAMGIHGIRPEMVTDAPTLSEFFEQVVPAQFPGTWEDDDHDLVVVAHNVGFDLPLVRPFTKREPLAICTLRLARKFLPEAENHKLQTLRAQYNLAGGDSHRADGDVATCVSLVQMIVEREQRSLMTLYREAQAPILVEKMMFGKHKGVRIAELDKGYARWCLGNMAELDPDLRASLENRVNS
jgi:exodeoxyribonuclease X